MRMIWISIVHPVVTVKNEGLLLRVSKHHFKPKNRDNFRRLPYCAILTRHMFAWYDTRAYDCCEHIK